MKCYASPLDVCHNPVKCSSLKECYYKEELNQMTSEKLTEFNIANDCQGEPKICRYRIECMLQRKCLVAIPGTVIPVESINSEIHYFKSGASSSDHKPPYECLTLTLLRRSAMRMQKGFHYGKHNWKKGVNDKQFILDRLNHAIEHLIKAQQEIDNDIVMEDDDLAAVVVNCMFAMEYRIPKKD